MIRTVLAISFFSTFAMSAKPNILWIIAEDMGPELGCYGTPQVRSPQIDRLAAEGVRYTKAFTVTGVCSTSRSSFMTGMYCFSIGAHNHRSHRKDGFRLPEGVAVLTDHFRRAGYFTANIRKLAKPADDAAFFKGTGKTDWNFSYDGQPFDGADWDALKGNQPFFAQINFPETHRGRDWDAAHKKIQTPADPSKVVIPPYYPDHPIVRENWAQYLNAVMALDRKVGYIRQRLAEDGLAENTIIVFFGDHGRAMMRGKQWPYESGLRVPLIVYYPKAIAAPAQIQPGTLDDRLIMAIDWSATALWMAGIPAPPKMQGRTFLGPDAITRDFAFGGRDRGDETVDRIRTVRDARYRYIRNYYPERPFLQLNRYKESMYPTIPLMRILHERGALTPAQAFLMQPTRPKEELYDLQNDPYEINNLAESADHAATLTRLRDELTKWVEDIDDQGRIPETPAVIAVHEAKMAGAYAKRMPEARERVRKRLDTGK
jgi:N-sulfoglucosamine sulfohydrolase